VTAAKHLLDVLNEASQQSRQRVLRDSLTRRIIEDGVCYIVRGLGTIAIPTLEELLSGTAAHVSLPTSTFMNASLQCESLIDEDTYGYIWLDPEPNTFSGMWFKSEILKRLPSFQIEVPTHEQIKTLRAGANVAQSVVPRLAISALSHNFVAVIGSSANGSQFKSLTVPGLPGVMVLSSGAVENQYQAAEILVHESLHLKFLDIDYFQHLFPIGFRPTLSPKITPVWHEGTSHGNWPIDRILTSMHVYVAMAVFFNRIALNADNDDQIDVVHFSARAFQCIERASWLLQTARDHSQYLTANGLNFVKWIAQILAELKTSAGYPPD